MTKPELTKIATALRTVLGDLLGHGMVEQCDACGTEARGTLRLEIVLRPMAAARLTRTLAAGMLDTVGAFAEVIAASDAADHRACKFPCGLVGCAPRNEGR